MDCSILSKISPKFTEETLVSILKKATKTDNVTLNNFELTGGDAKGDSYLSTIYKLKITGTVHNSKKINVSTVVKALPKNIGRRKTFRSTDFFRNEVAFYNKVWPELLNFQKEKKVPNPFVDVPECYVAHADGETDFIVLEDLCPQGYGSSSRQTGLDYAHCLLIMRLFARFHSLSLAYKHHHPEKYDQLANHLEETYFSERLKPWYQNFHRRLIEIWTEVISEDLAGTVYERKFKKAVQDDDLLNQVIRMAAQGGPLAVISQGDAWAPNFLIKYDPNLTPTGVKMIDFQLARNSSPALDISFFLFTCTEKTLRSEHWDSLFNEYYTVFAESLRNFGLNPNVLTKKALEKDFKENGKFGLAMALEAVPFSMIDDSEVVDLDQIQGDEAIEISKIWVLKSITMPENRKRLTDVVKDVVDRGLI